MIRLVTGIILVVLGSVPDVWYDLSGRQIYMPAREGLRTSNDPTTRPPHRKVRPAQAAQASAGKSCYPRIKTR